MNLNYTWGTPEHDYIFIPNPLTQTVKIKSEFRDAIEELLGTIELAGAAEGVELPNITIEEEASEYFFSHYIEIDTATLALYLSFEALNFMASGVEV